MKRFTHLLMIICLLTLSGCWDKSELNELAVVTGIAIDKADNGYRVSVQTVNSSEVTSQLGTSGFSPVTVRSESGVTMYDAIRKLSLTNSKRPYVSHLQVLVISKEIAKDGIGDILDYLSRDNDFRADFFIILTHESSAKDVLKMQTITEKIPTKALRAVLEISEKVSGSSLTIDMKELLNTLTLPGRSPVIPAIDLKGNIAIGQTKANTESTAPPVTYNYLGAGIFRGDQLIGWINKDEVKALNYLTDNIHQSIENFTCQDGEKMSIEILHSKTKRKVKLNKHGEPLIEVNIESEANIGESNCSIDLLDPDVIKGLESALAEQKVQEISKVLKTIQTEYQTDIFGFGEQIYRFQPKVWAEMESDWGEYFSNLDVQINVTINISQLGSIKNSIKQQIKE